ncbi:Fur family transcriptional regulator [Cohnella thailandensis]|uniref:Transcriptional repressor n=1 Tax=Cohnella thailandensis TaxID=557557 RepID=A0A841T9D1_9BACL|nr:Fur family transcriptional regulator [Cohnella thailandensis]MBB6638457.1 transcriptional repressor [Cohnella thailandensis]MBP1977483.1 Fur family peroxide stress response transcriptional regulator [Cohnella thailandensis]
MDSRVHHAVDQLKSGGVRMTPQRYAILQFLMESHVHPKADDIYRALSPQYPSLSVATVYNNLKLFVDAGLVRELTYGDNSSRFDADLSDHYHAICTNCGTMVDFEHEPVREVEDAARKLTGFVVHGHRMEIYGLCPTCAKMQS